MTFITIGWCGQRHVAAHRARAEMPHAMVTTTGCGLVITGERRANPIWTHDARSFAALKTRCRDCAAWVAASCMVQE